MKGFMSYVFGPRLFRIHRNGFSSPTGVLPGCPYNQTTLEERVQRAFDTISIVKNILYYTSPIWTVMLYRRGCFTISYGLMLSKFSACFAVFYIGLMLVRGFARQHNQVYVDFISTLERSGDPDNKRKYDFEFSHWPVDYTWDQAEERKYETPPYHFIGRLRKLRETDSIIRILFQGLPCEILSYVMSHGFGLSMVYPGSTTLLNTLINPSLQDGRNKLVEESGGKRAKIITKDGYSIDTMFVNRGEKGEMETEGSASWNRAGTLVICCEGNAGFFEVGCMVTPMECGYSVLGWNHPGFGESTGTPSPSAEINAIDAVMQYAIHRLGFPPENIIVFAWSIGAFAAVHAARLYPDLKGLFIDGTFDDVVPLAVKAMPVYFAGIVKSTVRKYINLNNAEVLKGYHGPVHFVRREMDEIMNTEGQRVVSSNCGNALLYRLLQHRFPNLFGNDEEERIEIKAALDTYLSKEDGALRDGVLSSFEVDNAKCEWRLKSYVDANSCDYPVNIGENLSMKHKQQLVLYLAVKHMSHYESSHCPPLPGSMFISPWDIRKDIQDAQVPSPSVSSFALNVPPSAQGEKTSEKDSQSSGSEDFEIIDGSNDNA